MNARSLGLTIASLGLLAALPCSPPRNLREGIETGTSVAKAGGNLAELKEDRGQCEELAKQQVSFNEEYAVGSATAVNFVMKNGGLINSYVDADKDQLSKPESVKFNEDKAEFNQAAYVATVGKNLAMQSDRPDINWTFGILKSDSQVNAFSAPGGFVLITNGAIKAVKNEDQLAGVIAHEIGHIVKKHGIKAYTTQKVESCKAAVTITSDSAGDLKGVAEAFIPPWLTDAVGLASSAKNLISKGADAFGFDDPANFGLVQLMAEKTGEKIAEGMGPKMEFEADQVATELLMSAGYSVEEYAKFVSGLGGSSTHPGGAARQKAILDYKASRLKSDFGGPDTKKKPIPLATSK